MLIAALAAGALLASGSPLLAQDNADKPAASGPHARGGAYLEQLAKNLDLTDAQKPKVKAALEEQMQKMGALRQDASLTPEDRRAKMKTIREDMKAKMKEILTPEQFAKYEKMGPGNRPNHRPGGTPPAGDQPAEK